MTLVVHHIINNIELEQGGAQRVVRQLHSGLRQQGVASRIVAICDSADGVVDTVSLKNTSPYGWRAFVSTLQYIRQHCSPEDIIHVHLFPALLHVSLAVRLLRWSGQLVCTEHNTSNRRRSHPMGRFIDGLVYPTYQRIYCISQGTLDSLKRWMPDQQNKLKVVENGVKLSHGEFSSKQKTDRLVIVSAGRLHKQKNYETAIRAIALLKDLNIEYRIAGIGSEENALRAQCSHLKLEDTVKFYGYVNNIDSFLTEADIFLMPSRWEGFGLAAVEAMNAGLPVIASNVPGIREVLDTPRPCGILVSPDSPDEIASAVRALKHQNKRQALGKRAFMRSRCFSEERMTERYRDEYNQLTLARNQSFSKKDFSKKDLSKKAQEQY